MNKSDALKIDTDFYIDFDDSINCYCVFGNNSGFSYFVGINEKECEKYITENFPNKLQVDFQFLILVL